MLTQPVETIGAPGRIRTPNLLIRSQALYPVELRARGGNGIQAHTGPGNGFEDDLDDEPARLPHCRRNATLRIYDLVVNGDRDRVSVNRLVSVKSIE